MDEKNEGMPEAPQTQNHTASNAMSAKDATNQAFADDPVIKSPSGSSPSGLEPANKSPSGLDPEIKHSQAETNTPKPPISVKPQPPKKASTGRKLLGCLGGIIGFIILSILGLSLIFVGGGGENNPFFELVGIDFTNLQEVLITLINVIFGTLVFFTFLIAIIGIFRVGMSKKDDKVGRGKGFKLFFGGLTAFIIFLIIWVSSYIYLRTKVPVTNRTLAVIVTDPKETLGLTAPMTISFDASNVTFRKSQFQILQYSWDFGDGEIGSGNPISHFYKSKGPENGLFRVTLTITYKDLKNNEEKKALFETDVSFANEKVTASFTVTPESGNAPLEVILDASESLDPDGEIVSYEWDLDDDNEFDDADTKTLARTFEQVGKYRIALRVVDNNGEYDIAEKEIQVEKATPLDVVIKHTNKDETFLVGQSYTFDGGDSGSPNGLIEKFSWNFGDGTKVVNAKSASHIFEDPGTYKITLKITDVSGISGENTLDIEAGYPAATPEALVKTLPAGETDEKGNKIIKGSVPLRVQLDASSSGDRDNDIVEYEWDFDGDGEEDASGPEVSYTYEKAGEFFVSLRLTDAKGNESGWKGTVIVEGRGLLADIKASPLSGTIPLTVDFDASGSSYPDNQIVSYEWDFGDGTGKKIGNAQISHLYDSIGEFKASVTVIGGDGKKSEATTFIYVRPIALKACYKANVTRGKAPLTVTFDPSCSEGSIVKYTWKIGDKTERDRQLTYTFERAGSFDVILEVADNENVISRYSEEIVVTD